MAVTVNSVPMPRIQSQDEIRENIEDAERTAGGLLRADISKTITGVRVTAILSASEKATLFSHLDSVYWGFVSVSVDGGNEFTAKPELDSCRRNRDNPKYWNLGITFRMR